MAQVIRFPIEQRLLLIHRQDMVERLHENYPDDEVRLIVEEVDEIINVNQFNNEEIVEFYKSINVGVEYPEIIGAINDR